MKVKSNTILPLDWEFDNSNYMAVTCQTMAECKSPHSYRRQAWNFRHYYAKARCGFVTRTFYLISYFMCLASVTGNKTLAWDSKRQMKQNNCILCQTCILVFFNQNKIRSTPHQSKFRNINLGKFTFIVKP